MTEYNPLGTEGDQRWFDKQLEKISEIPKKTPKTKTVQGKLGAWYHRKTFFEETEIINKYLTGEYDDN